MALFLGKSSGGFRSQRVSNMESVSIVMMSSCCEKRIYISILSVCFAFCRVNPEMSLDGVRQEILDQLGMSTLPSDYMFLRNVGRCLTKVLFGLFSLWCYFCDTFAAVLFNPSTIEYLLSKCYFYFLIFITVVMGRRGGGGGHLPPVSLYLLFTALYWSWQPRLFWGYFGI